MSRNVPSQTWEVEGSLDCFHMTYTCMRTHTRTHIHTLPHICNMFHTNPLPHWEGAPLKVTMLSRCTQSGVCCKEQLFIDSISQVKWSIGGTLAFVCICGWLWAFVCVKSNISCNSLQIIARNGGVKECIQHQRIFSGTFSKRPSVGLEGNMIGMKILSVI